MYPDWTADTNNTKVESNRSQRRETGQWQHIYDKCFPLYQCILLNNENSNIINLICMDRSDFKPLWTAPWSVQFCWLKYPHKNQNSLACWAMLRICDVQGVSWGWRFAFKMQEETSNTHMPEQNKNFFISPILLPSFNHQCGKNPSIYHSPFRWNNPHWIKKLLCSKFYLMAQQCTPWTSAISFSCSFQIKTIRNKITGIKRHRRSLMSLVFFVLC